MAATVESQATVREQVEQACADALWLLNAGERGAAAGCVAGLTRRLRRKAFVSDLEDASRLTAAILRGDASEHACRSALQGLEVLAGEVFSA